jgi:enoyl-CoA hydratase/carnithine racemase
MTRGGDDGQLVLYEVADDVAVVTMNRPQQNNGWTVELQEQFFDRLDDAAIDPAVRAIVVTGAGRLFCPGADIASLREASQRGRLNGLPGHRHMTHPLSIPKPLIAAINGSCAGFGFVLAAMCDIRFAASGAKFTTSFVRRGVAAEHTITYLLPRQIGLQLALDLLLTGRVFEAQEALKLGFLLGVVDPPESVLEVACSYARELATWSSPTAMAVIRNQVYEDLDNDFATSRANSAEYMVRFSQRPDFAEGVASYTERRPPSFPPLSATFSMNHDHVEPAVNEDGLTPRDVGKPTPIG